MCGIAGVLRIDGAAADPQLVARMTATLAHRGPDGEGVHVDGPCGLGHRRLAIIDPGPAGAQPMTNEDRTLWLTYNGELYGADDLRRQLEASGHVFRSHTDSEVILHAYEQWGHGCLARFNGMFAFALWDGRQRRLWLVRDRLGIKPLFVAQLPDRVLWGSEAKAILADPTTPRAVDHTALAQFLAFNYTPAPRTLFADIRQLEPAHHLLIDADGRTTMTRYWRVDYQPKTPLGPTSRLRAFDDLLADAVRLRLRSDVPFGAFLSGGIDSSAVTYWMRQHLDQELRTFSIRFAETSFDEGPYARRVAGRLRTTHRERVVSADDCLAVVPRLTWHGEEPTADSSMVAVWLLAELAREDVAMVLAGDGADELLAGYETYTAHHLLRLIQRIPGALPLARAVVGRLPISHGKVPLSEKLRRFVAGASQPWARAHGCWRMINDDDARRRLLADELDPGDPLALFASGADDSRADAPLDALLHVDTTLYLPSDMLVKVDRMTMAHGLEARVPFLDHRLVELVARLPPRDKLRGWTGTKAILKRSLRGRLPGAVLHRPKAGFNLPVSAWLAGPLREAVADALSPEAIRRIGWLRPVEVARMIDAHHRREADHGHALWGLYTLARWHEAFLQP